MVAGDDWFIIPRGKRKPAKGGILESERPFVLNEEEIPVGRLRVTRGYQLARGADGRTHL